MNNNVMYKKSKVITFTIALYFIWHKFIIYHNNVTTEDFKSMLDKLMCSKTVS